MRILVLTPGKPPSSEYRTATAEYEQRLAHHLALTWEYIKAGSTDDEGAAMLRKINPSDFVLLLDERGEEIASVQFADLIHGHLIGATKQLVVIIGGAYGVSGAVRGRANKTIRLSSLVFPHQLVRLILVEQLYRAHTIISGGKYHHQ